MALPSLTHLIFLSCSWTNGNNFTWIPSNSCILVVMFWKWQRSPAVPSPMSTFVFPKPPLYSTFHTGNLTYGVQTSVLCWTVRLSPLEWQVSPKGLVSLTQDNWAPYIPLLLRKSLWNCGSLFLGSRTFVKFPPCNRTISTHIGSKYWEKLFDFATKTKSTQMCFGIILHIEGISAHSKEAATCLYRFVNNCCHAQVLWLYLSNRNHLQHFKPSYLPKLCAAVISLIPAISRPSVACIAHDY